MTEATQAFTYLQMIQCALKAAKSQRNTFGNYDYRSCEDILEAVKPLLSEHCCALSVSDEVVMIGDRFYIKATSTLHTLSGPISATALAREQDSKKGMDPAQLTGATSSYARKYSLSGLLCVDDNKDVDTMDNREQTSPKQQSNPAVPSMEAKATKLYQLCAKTHRELAEPVWNEHQPKGWQPLYDALCKFAAANDIEVP